MYKSLCVQREGQYTCSSNYHHYQHNLLTIIGEQIYFAEESLLNCPVLSDHLVAEESLLNCLVLSDHLVAEESLLN